MKYFLHDTSAFADEKITQLYMEFGFEGLGLFYTILERLARWEKPMLESVLKTQLYIGKRLQKQLDFMYKIDIISVTNGEVFSKTLLNNANFYQIKKEKTRKRVAEWRAKQEDVTRYKAVTGVTRNAPKEKKRKEKEKSYKKEVTQSITNIVEFLNSTVHSSYRIQTSKTQALIKARLAEGFTVENFQTVIKLKNNEWKNTEMEKFIRPETLFGTKFESYLNQKNAEVEQHLESHEDHLKRMGLKL